MDDYIARYLVGEGTKHLVRNGVAACGRAPTSSDSSGWHGGLRVEHATRGALPLCRECDATSGVSDDELVEKVSEHTFMEAVGGYIECSCGWPTKEQFEAGEPEALHVAKETEPLIRERVAAELRDAAIIARGDDS